MFNTWMNLSWYFWPSLRFLDPIRSFYRFLAPFTIINSYGVFPPHAVPKERFFYFFIIIITDIYIILRFTPVIEGSNDGKTWKEYEYKYLTKLPWLLSPFHPRYINLFNF